MKNYFIDLRYASLGDCFAINGLFQYYAIANNLYILTNSNTVKSLFEDCSNIHIVDSEEIYSRLYNSLKNSEYLPVWVFTATPVNNTQSYYINWNKQIYDNYHMPPSMQYEYCKYPKHTKTSLPVPSGDYIVVHKHMNSLTETFFNYNIEPFNPYNCNVVEIKPGVTDNLLDYLPILEGAKQIHVTPSSVHTLVDTFHKKFAAEKYIHLVRKDYLSEYSNRYNNWCWKPVKYPEHLKL